MLLFLNLQEFHGHMVTSFLKKNIQDSFKIVLVRNKNSFFLMYSCCMKIRFYSVSVLFDFKSMHSDVCSNIKDDTLRLINDNLEE